MAATSPASSLELLEGLYLGVFRQARTISTAPIFTAPCRDCPTHWNFTGYSLSRHGAASP